nr:immunoglobulin light chain junction region [Macaca mulatta]
DYYCHVWHITGDHYMF